jgi:hypothetical protein
VRIVAFAAAVVALTVGAATAAGQHAVLASCTGAQLSGTFKVVRGSAGAGNIVYALVLKNRSTRACTVTGLPRGRLLGKTGKLLPTHIRAAFPGALTAVLVILTPGARARAQARFSPDVPGTGEPTSGTQCEPTAYWFRVTAPGGGVTKAPILPPTPVCEHGSLQFTAYSRVR